MKRETAVEIPGAIIAAALANGNARPVIIVMSVGIRHEHIKTVDGTTKQHDH
jgi:hypothetical protein